MCVCACVGVCDCVYVLACVCVYIFWCMCVCVCVGVCVCVYVFGAAAKVGCCVYNVRTLQMQLLVVFQRGVVSLLTLPHLLDTLFSFYLR